MTSIEASPALVILFSFRVVILLFSDMGCHQNLIFDLKFCVLEHGLSSQAHSYMSV